MRISLTLHKSEKEIRTRRDAGADIEMKEEILMTTLRTRQTRTRPHGYGNTRQRSAPVVAAPPKTKKRKNGKTNGPAVAFFSVVGLALLFLPGALLPPAPPPEPVANWQGSGTLYAVSGRINGQIDANIVRVGGSDLFLDVFFPDRTEGCLDPQTQQIVSCQWLAGHRLAEWTQGRSVTCQVRSDSLDRNIARCYDEGVDLNARLVGEGLAFPDRAFGHNARDIALQERARASGKGYYATRLVGRDRIYISPTQRNDFLAALREERS